MRKFALHVVILAAVFALAGCTVHLHYEPHKTVHPDPPGEAGGGQAVNPTDPITELLAKMDAVRREWTVCECDPVQKGAPEECHRCRVHTAREGVVDLLAEWWWAENAGRCSSAREFESLVRECDEYRKRISAEEAKP